MRVSTYQIHTQATAQLQLLGAQAARSQEQISAGKKLLEASDDPIGAARVVGINQDIAARERYVANIDAANVQLALEDSVLNQVTQVIGRIQELTLQAGSGIQTLADRQYIAGEIRARFDELLSLGNSRSPDGQYLFSGHQTGETPFSLDGDVVAYRGDEGQRQVQVSREQLVSVGNHGAEVFMNVPVSTVQVLESYRSSAGGVIENIEVFDQELADAFYPEKLRIEFRPAAEAGGVANFSVTRQSDGRIVDGLANVAFSGADEVEAAGIRFTVTGSPQEGDQFVISSSKRKSLFETVATLAQGLEEVDSALEPEVFRQLIDGSIEGLNAATDQVLEVRADVGARMNSIDSARSLHADLQLRLGEMKSAVEDLDFAAAVSQLAYESFVLEAAQQSYVRINGLSLFNRL